MEVSAKRIRTRADYQEVAETCLNATNPVALTGAGISVDCAIPDFRSRGGLWSVFAPEEYATLTAFLTSPEKAWRMFRALGETVRGKKPGPAHLALSRSENSAWLKGVITQNIDGLHSLAGSRTVIEIHGDYRTLHCLRCGHLEPADDSFLREGHVPTCRFCEFSLKPNVVLFEESVRGMDEVDSLLRLCDLLVVIGTSATVYPAAEFPLRVLNSGGKILEFNLEMTGLTPSVHYFFQGRVDETVPKFLSALLDTRRRILDRLPGGEYGGFG